MCKITAFLQFCLSLFCRLFKGGSFRGLPGPPGPPGAQGPPGSISKVASYAESSNRDLLSREESISSELKRDIFSIIFLCNKFNVKAKNWGQILCGNVVSNSEPAPLTEIDKHGILEKVCIAV